VGEGEKREGADELFEDLDRFFAPISDVEFPEAPEEDEAQPPREEHVAVQPPREEPEPVEAEPEPIEAEEPEPVEAEPQPIEAEVPDVEGEEEEEPEGPEEAEEVEEAWYDTEAMEPVDERTVVVPDAPTPGQSGLFLGEEEPEPQPVEPWAAAEPPSEEEVEAAAEHFAESIRAEEAEGEEQAGGEDILTGLGAEEVEEDILSDLEEEEEAAAAVRTVKVGAEGLGGPSWQEPTSVEVGADLERVGRDVPAAFMTGLVLAALAFGSLLISNALFAFVAAAIALIGQFELFLAMQKQHRQPATAVGLITGALVLWGAYSRGEGAVLAMAAMGVVATFLWYLAVPAIHRKDVLVNVGLTALNVAYIPVLASFLFLTLGVGSESDGRALVVTVIGLSFLFDTSAFFFGSIFGGSSIRRPLAPDTSPKKSWEGLIVAAIVTVIFALALVPSFVAPFEDKRLEAFLLAIAISAAATFGDLAESLIKRDLGVKDMGNILPGHGGVLDRVDSLLFTAPAAYLLFRVVFA
jgi:phosphatidate cytidylyltransferase